MGAGRALLVLVLMLCATAVARADGAMTAGELQQICLGADAESKSACRFYLLGIVQGMSVGMNIADGKTKGGRPCVPEDMSSSALELAVKLKMGQVLMVYPDDRNLDASGFVGAAIISTFPCRSSKR